MRWLRVLAFFLALMVLPALAYAQTGPLSVDPPALTLTGTLGGGPFAASLRLTASAPLSGVHVLPSDLTDVTGDGHFRDPLPASAVTLQPAGFEMLALDTPTQVLVQTAPPAVAGIYSGTLLVYWRGPQPGQLAIPLTVVARTRPTLAFQGVEQITVNATRGQTVYRSVTLRDTTPHGSPVTDLRAISQDLQTTEGKVLEAGRVRAALPATTLAGGHVLTATLEVNLRGVAPGAYSGAVLFEADDGAPLPLPVTVNVRYGWSGPIMVTVVGVVLGLALASYQAKGRERDMLVLRIVAVRRELDKADGPQAGFKARLGLWLGKAEADVRVEAWATARAAVETAEALLRKWYAGDWQAQIQHLQGLETRLKQAQADHPRAVTPPQLLHRAQMLLETLADLESPAVIREKTLELETQFARFEAAWERYEALNERRGDTPDWETGEQWRTRLADLQRRLEQQLPDGPEWPPLERDLQALGEEMLQAAERARPPSEGWEELAKGPLTRGGADERAAEAVEHLRRLLAWPWGRPVALPEAGPFTLQKARQAQTTLAWFSFVTHALGGLVLAALGFSALYLANPTFGARPITDYLALLAWGLGAQATFSDVVGLLQGWGVPFGRKT